MLIRDRKDFDVYVGYIARNAVKAGLVERAEDYPYCSANGKFELDAFPQGLKPGSGVGQDGAAEAAPLQSE
jgi:hypothetical protein